MKRLIAVCCAVLAFALPLRAEIRPLSGQDDPAFQAAFETWLKGDEAQALPALAALAAADNAAAQVLIGLIDVTPQYNGPWLMALPRADRIALMRVPLGKAGGQAGLSGRNWLHEAARTEPLAQAWLQLWDGNAGTGVMLEFARLGENSAARTAAKWLARREVKGFGELAADPDFPDFAMALAVRELAETDPARAKTSIDAMDAADPGRAFVETYRPDPDALLHLAKTHGALRILDHHLAVLCPIDPDGDPNARANRLAEALDLIGGWWGLASLGPPAETLIDADRWALMPQGSGSFIRLLPAVDLQKLPQMDRCLAFLSGLVAEERGQLK